MKNNNWIYKTIADKICNSLIFFEIVYYIKSNYKNLYLTYHFINIFDTSAMIKYKKLIEKYVIK